MDRHSNQSYITDPQTSRAEAATLCKEHDDLGGETLTGSDFSERERERERERRERERERERELDLELENFILQGL